MADTVSAPADRGQAWRRLAPVVGVLLATSVTVGYLAVVDPNESGNYPTCPFLALTGYYCPGCGSLRAIHALAHLDLVTALQLNILTVCVMLPIAVFHYARWSLERGLGRSIRKNMAHPGWIWALFWGLLAFWLLRNVPLFSILAPYGVSP